MCGVVCSNRYYYSFLSGLKTIFADSSAFVDAGIPLLILSGDNDAVGKGGRLVEKLCAFCERAGLAARYKLYGGARHDIFREINRAEVFSDIARFLDAATPKKN